MLWWWIVGLASLQIHQKSSELDNEEIMQCNDEVFKLHPNAHNQQEIKGNDHIKQAADYKDRNTYDLITLDTKHNEVGTITIEQELKLTLLRHWTLYDSICNSNYLVSCLKIGREPGNKTLKRFLITIGVSQEQAKQKYQYMDPEVKNNLKRKVIDKSQEFNIDKILISSYVRQMTPSMQVSALDAA